MKNKKICLFGSFGWKDIGDEAMLTMHIDYLKSLGVSPESIYLISSSPDYTSNYWKIPRRNCFLDTNLPNGMDNLIVTGGGTINTRPGSSSINRMYRVIKWFRNQGVPVFVSGQTIGPLGINSDHDIKAKWIISNVEKFLTRDSKYSKDYLEGLGLPKDSIVQTTDDAVGLSFENASIPKDINNFIDKTTVAFNTTLYTTNSIEKRSLMQQICEKIINMGNKVLLVPHSPEDTIFLKGLQKKLGNKNTMLYDTLKLDEHSLKKVISKCKVGIGGRYHFLVFCLDTGVPCVGLAGNHYSFIKQDGFASQFNKEHYIIKEKDLNLDNVIRVYRQIKNDKDIPRIRVSESFSLIKTWLKI